MSCGVYLDPMVLGRGLRLFADGLPTVPLVLADRRLLPKGVQYLAYRPAQDGADG
jgi:hypothetical protein